MNTNKPTICKTISGEALVTTRSTGIVQLRHQFLSGVL
jgi:hypothetical protein